MLDPLLSDYDVDTEHYEQENHDEGRPCENGRQPRINILTPPEAIISLKIPL